VRNCFHLLYANDTKIAFEGGANQKEKALKIIIDWLIELSNYGDFL
jgi:hypothetical protein